MPVRYDWQTGLYEWDPEPDPYWRSSNAATGVEFYLANPEPYRMPIYWHSTIRTNPRFRQAVRVRRMWDRAFRRPYQFLKWD